MHFLNNYTEALGWALLHFLWQGAVVALLLGLCLRVLRQRTAQVRYALAGLALLLMLGAFLGTLAVVWERPVVAVVSENRSHETYTAYRPYQEPLMQPAVIPEAMPPLIPQAPPVAAAPLAEAAPLPAPPPVPFSEKVRPYLPWALGLWAVGVVCFALRFLFALLAVRGWKRSGQDIVSAEWKQRFSQLRAVLEVSRPVQFLSSAAIAVPMVIGWLKPVVLVPAGLFTGLTTAQLEAILAHELAHIRRHDYLANLFQHFMETLFFYHPAVWWISTKMREEREHCCDDLAASACGGALGYAKALTALEELRGVAPVLSVSATGGSLLARIRRILGLPEEKSRSWPLGLLAVLALAIIPFALAKEEGRPAPLENEAIIQATTGEVGNQTCHAVYVAVGKTPIFAIIEAAGNQTGPSWYLPEMSKVKPWTVVRCNMKALNGEYLELTVRSSNTNELEVKSNFRKDAPPLSIDLTKGRVLLLTAEGNLQQVTVKNPLLNKQEAMMAAWDEATAKPKVEGRPAPHELPPLPGNLKQQIRATYLEAYRKIPNGPFWHTGVDRSVVEEFERAKATFEESQKRNPKFSPDQIASRLKIMDGGIELLKIGRWPGGTELLVMQDELDLHDLLAMKAKWQEKLQADFQRGDVQICQEMLQRFQQFIARAIAEAEETKGIPADDLLRIESDGTMYLYNDAKAEAPRKPITIGELHDALDRIVSDTRILRIHLERGTPYDVLIPIYEQFRKLFPHPSLQYFSPVEFRAVSPKDTPFSETWRAPVPVGKEAWLQLERAPILTMEDVKSAVTQRNEAESNPWSILLELTPAGAEKMSTFSKAHLHEALAIVADGVVLTAPTIQSEMGASVMITGNFTEAAAQKIVNKITKVRKKEGGRPAPLENEKATKGSETLPLLERGGGILPPSPDASPAAPGPDPTKAQQTPNPSISPEPVSAKAYGRDAHATSLPGTWAMAGGVSLHIYGEVIHGSDVSTTAILSWPALGNRPAQHWSTWIAGDVFAARSLYAVAWDAQHAVLWIASRDVSSNAKNASGKPIANRFTRVDFSDPNLITETSTNGWPKEHPPSAEVMAQMATLMEVPQDQQPDASTLYSWSTAGNPERINLANVQNLSVQMDKASTLTVSLESEKKTCTMDELAQTIKALALDWEMKRASTQGDLKPTQRVTIAASADISAEALQKIIQGCTKANFGPLASGTGVPPVSPDASAAAPTRDPTKGEPTQNHNISPDPASAPARGQNAPATASLADAQYLEACALAADGEKLLEAKDNTAAYYKFKDAAKLLDTLSKNHPNMRSAELISTREKLKQLTENALRGEIVKHRPMMKIRGVNLGDFPGQTDASKFPEVLEPYPGKPKLFRERKDVFSVALADQGPSIYFKAGSDHFYFKVWNFPDPDLYYGPIPGHPSHLGIAAWMREPEQFKRPDKMLFVASEMMKSGDETLAEIALGWLDEVQQGTPRSYERAVEEVKTWLAAHPDSQFAATGRETLTKLTSTAGRVADEWDKARPILPDDRYQAGELMAADLPGVVWGEPNPVGLRLGVAQLEPTPSYKFGDEIKLTSIYLRNDGQKPIKFSYSLAPKHNFYAQIHGPKEEISSTGIIMNPTKGQHCRLEPGRALKLSANYQMTLMVESERANNTTFIPAGATNPSKPLPTNPICVNAAGDCKLRVICNLSGYDVLDESGHMLPTPAGEWTGRLAAADIPIKILEQDAGSPAPLERGTGVPPVSPDTAPTRDPTKGEPTPNNNISPDPGSVKADGRDAHATFAAPLAPTPPDALNLRIAENLSLLSPKVQPKPSGWLAEETNGAAMEMVTDAPRGLPWLEENYPPSYIPMIGGAFRVNAPGDAPLNRTITDPDSMKANSSSLLTHGSIIPPSTDPRINQINRANKLIQELTGEPNSGPTAKIRSLQPPGKMISTTDPLHPTADPFAPPTAPDKLAEARQNGIQIKVMDAEGKPLKDFRVIAGVPSSVSAEFEKAHNVKVANWQSHTLHFGHREGLIWPLDKAYDDMALRVEADGYVPQMVAGLDRKKGGQELSFKFVPDQGVSGSVTLPDGKSPASKATVVLAMIRRNFRYLAKEAHSDDIADLAGGPTTPREQWDRPRSVSADDAGKFTLPTEIDPTAVVLIYHQDGVLEMSYAKWLVNPNVTLQPWGRIRGRVHWGDRVGAGETIDLSVNHGDAYGYPDIISQSDSTTADAEGNFTFERVLPGLAQLSIPFKTKDAKGAEFTTYQDGMTIHADVKAPQTEVTMGGVGRLVKGQLMGRDNWDGVTFHFHPTAPHIGFAGDDMMWQAWRDFQNSPKGPVFFRDGLKVNVDGSFAIPGMLPGRYQIFFSKDGEKSHVASSQFTVEVEKPNVKPAPLILPEIKAIKEEGRPAPPEKENDNKGGGTPPLLERGTGVPPVSLEASPADSTPDPTKVQSPPKPKVSIVPGSRRADGRDAHATMTFAEHCKKVAAGKGVVNELNTITAWGAEQQGLQAGLIMLGKSVWGEPCAGWIVVQNTSATETREFTLCQSSNTLHFLAEDEHGNALTCQEWFGKLFGNDALITKKLGPGEQLAFSIDAITISQFADQPAPSIHLPENERTCRLWFDLDQIIRPQVPMKSFTTGKVLMNMVQGPEEEVRRREALKAAQDQARAVPKVELLQDAEGSLLVITRGVERVRIYSSEPLKHTLTVDTRTKEEAWSLHGDVIVEHKDGTVSKLPANWASDAPEKFVVDGQTFQRQTFRIKVHDSHAPDTKNQEVSSADAEPDNPWHFKPEIFLRIQPDSKVLALFPTDNITKENELTNIRKCLQELDARAIKYALSRALANQRHGVIEWKEEQSDGERMLKLKIAEDGKIQFLPTPDRMIERKLEPARLTALKKWITGLGQTSVPPKVTSATPQEGEFHMWKSFEILPGATHFSIIDNKNANTVSHRFWSANGPLGNSNYEQIKARLLELVK